MLREDHEELMRIFSRPRPNGSAAERETACAIRYWLQERGIPYQAQSYTNYPFFFEAIGAWLILSRSLLAVSIIARWGWISLILALIGLAGGTLDVLLGWHLVSWPGARKADNFLIGVEPFVNGQTHPFRDAWQNIAQELIICAHYDSKTEPLDHYQRMFLLKAAPLGITLTILVGITGLADGMLLAQGSTAQSLSYALGIILSIPLLLLALALGLNLTLGRFIKPSQGAVDNGASCSILLGLADRFHRSQNNGEPMCSKQACLKNTRLTIALFCGEEAGRQGSRAYTNWRRHGSGWPLPAAAINLEAMGQDGDYVFWELDGTIFKLEPTSAFLNQAIIQTTREVTGQPVRPFGPVLSDGASFMAVGIPSTTFGTRDKRLGESGFHRPTDNLGRVDMERLPETVDILWQVIQKLDKEGVED